MALKAAGRAADSVSRIKEMMQRGARLSGSPPTPRVGPMERPAGRYAGPVDQSVGAAVLDAVPTPSAPDSDAVAELALMIRQATNSGGLEGVHPATLSRLREDAIRVAQSGQLENLKAAIGKDGAERFDQFLHMAADPVMYMHEQNVANAAAYRAAAERLPGRPAPMRPETPLYQPLIVPPGGMPGKRAHAAAEEAERALASERLAPGGYLVDRDSILAQTGVESAGELPLGVRANTDRGGTPFENRAAGQREAAGSARDRAAVEAGRTVPYISDRSLNRASAQETYDQLVQAVAGTKTKPQYNLNRATAGLDVEDSADELGALSIEDVADSVESGDPVPQGRVAARRKRLGGGRSPSRQVDAIDRLYVQNGRVVNPFDIDEFAGDPNALATKLLETNYQRGDETADLARLSQQVAEEIGRYGASPTAAAEQVLRANTFFKPGTPSWQMAREEIANQLVRRFEGRTAKPSAAAGGKDIDLAAIAPPDKPTVDVGAPADEIKLDEIAAPDTPNDNLDASAVEIVDPEEALAGVAPKPAGKKGGRKGGAKNKPANSGDIDLASIEPPPGQIDLAAIPSPEEAAAAAGGGGKPPRTRSGNASQQGPEYGRDGFDSPDEAAPPRSRPDAGGADTSGRDGFDSPDGMDDSPAVKKSAGDKSKGPDVDGEKGPPAGPLSWRERAWKHKGKLGALAGLGAGVALVNSMQPPSHIPLPPGMDGGTNGEGTTHPPITVAVPPEARSGGEGGGAGEEARLLELMGRIRGGTLGRMPMLQTMQEYY